MCVSWCYLVAVKHKMTPQKDVDCPIGGRNEMKEGWGTSFEDHESQGGSQEIYLHL